MIHYTHVRFATGDEKLQALFDAAERQCLGNLKRFGSDTVLVEGGGYEKIWLETQPMGGEMYAKRNLEAGLNNQLLFLRHQRADGRLPGSICVEEGQVVPQFNKLQGFCFPAPALNLYYLIGKDAEYLHLLEEGLRRFDEYLWRVRDSDGDGCLESWCVYDTGEDRARRYGDAPCWWEADEPPAGCNVVPMASMDFMSFSFSARDHLAKICAIRGDAAGERLWRARAQEVAAKLRACLWDEEKGACYDRDKTGRTLPTLTHNNLRCMYWGSFSQDMADRFVREHLLNPAEFWTNMPLPSVAANDPLFFNDPINDWSGQPEGLTYQRAIRALENYGWQQLLLPLGRKLFAAVQQGGGVFTQQFDPFTMAPSQVAIPSQQEGAVSGPVVKQAAYGPTLLSVLEYISRLHGVHIEGDEVWFGLCSDAGAAYVYEQAWGDHTYRIEHDGRAATVFADDRAVCSAPAGLRIVTDTAGRFLRAASLIPPEEKQPEMQSVSIMKACK